MHEVHGCNDHFVAQMIKELPELQALDLSRTDVTGVAVKDIVRAGHVDHLTLNDCRYLGHDAVDWARSQGLIVRHRLSDQSGGGKKVRY